MNELRYPIVIHEFLWPELKDMGVDDVYLQQDGITCHKSGETIGLLREKFPAWVISRNGNYNWRPKLYDSAPQSIQEFREKIRAVIDEIETQMCENVMENFMKRAWSWNVAVQAIWMILFFINNGKPSTIKWNKNWMISRRKTRVLLINPNETSNWKTLYT